MIVKLRNRLVFIEKLRYRGYIKPHMTKLCSHFFFFLYFCLYQTRAREIKMKCNRCGGEMNYSHTYIRGRHVREIYTCPKCKLNQGKRVRTLPYTSRRKF